MRGARLPMGVLAVLMSLVWAVPAWGTTFCVSAPGCSGTGEPGVQQALDAASSHSGADTIRVGPGTYHGPFTDASGNSVTVLGAGNQTVFDNPAGSTTGSPSSTLEADEPTSAFSSLAVVVPAGAEGTGIVSDGRLDHLLVRDVASDTADVGVAVNAGSLSHSRVALAGSPGGGVVPTGIMQLGFIQDDLVHMLSPGARGIQTTIIEGSTEARQVTLVGPGDSATSSTDTASRGVSVTPTGFGFGSSAAIALDGVIITGFAHPLAAEGSQSPPFICMSPPCADVDNVATITVSYSDFDPVNDIKAPADSNINTNSTDIDVNPGFRNPSSGDYSLRLGSAVIDRGDPAVPRAASNSHPADSTTDLAGHRRKSNGNRDGTAVVDMGAFEYTDRRPVAVLSGPAHGLVGQALHFKGSASHDPDGDSITFLWTFGDGKRSRLANPTHTYLRPGIFTVRLVVTDALRAPSAPKTKRVVLSSRR